MAEYSTGRTASHGNPALLIGFVSLIFAAALLLTFGECLFNSNRGRLTSVDHRRTPLMSRRVEIPKPKGKKWWQFWRRRPVLDVEQCPETPNQNNDTSPNVGCGTISVFTDFDAVHQAALASSLSANNPWIAPRRGRWVSDHRPQEWIPRTSYIWSPGEQPTPGDTPVDSFESTFGHLPQRTDSFVNRPVTISGDSLEIPPQKPESFADEYELICHLVFSSEGHVFQVQHRETGKQRIIKQIWAERQADGTFAFPNEPDILASAIQIQHANIVQLLGIAEHRSGPRPFYNVVTDFCNAGDSMKLIDVPWKRRERCPQQLFLAFIYSMIDALCFLHFGDISYDPEADVTTSVRHRQREILHRDIKPGNVFMSWSENSPFGLPSFQLGDFGHACTDTANRGIGGTKGFRAPEVQKVLDQADPRHPLADPFMVDNCHRLPNLHSKASDVYSLAASIYFLLSGQLFDSMKSDLEAEFADSSLADCSEILAMLKACLSEKPADRPQINKYHGLSARIKRDLKQWHQNGGHLDSAIWTAQLPARDPSEQIGLLEQADQAPSSVYSRTSSYEPMQPLRRVNANNNLRPSWNTMMRDAGLELPFRVEQVTAAQPTSFFSSDSSVGSNRRPSWL